MGLFWGLAAMLIIVTIVTLLRPLLRSTKTNGVDAQAAKLAIYKLQFAELEQDQVNAVLSAEQYAIAKKELERRLLAEVGPVSTQHTTFVASKPLAWSIVFIFPIAAILTYQQIGSPRSIPLQIGQQTQPDQAKTNAAAEVEPILKSLREKLDQDPNDPTGWALLARAYGKLHRYDEAFFAFERAVKLSPGDADLLTDYAVVLAMANNRKITEKSQVLITRALEINPRQTMALMLAASLAYEQHDYKTAIVLWERLQPDLPLGSEIADSVASSLAKAKALTTEKR